MPNAWTGRCDALLVGANWAGSVDFPTLLPFVPLFSSGSLESLPRQPIPAVTINFGTSWCYWTLCSIRMSTSTCKVRPCRKWLPKRFCHSPISDDSFSCNWRTPRGELGWLEFPLSSSGVAVTQWSHGDLWCYWIAHSIRVSILTLPTVYLYEGAKNVSNVCFEGGPPSPCRRRSRRIASLKVTSNLGEHVMPLNFVFN